MIIKGLFSILLFCCLFCEGAFAQSLLDKKLVILHTNDLHSRLTGFSSKAKYTLLGPNHNDTQEGFARIATLIDDEKKKNGDNVIVLDAGDFLMGSLFSMLEESSGFQLSLMKKMVYDVVILGNHEFDFGCGLFLCQ